MSASVSALVGMREHVGFLKLIGDVRYPAAPAIDRAVGKLMTANEFDSFVVDLREVGHVDSTILGLVARVGGVTLRRYGRRAVIACVDEDMLTGLRAVGFDTVFVVVAKPPDEPEHFEPVECAETSGEELAATMISAHRELMGMSEQMRRELEPSVTMLERELAGERR